MFQGGLRYLRQNRNKLDLNLVFLNFFQPLHFLFTVNIYTITKYDLSKYNPL